MSELAGDQPAANDSATRAIRPSESGAQARQTAPKRVREIDFSRPAKFTQDQQRRIGRAHDAFCRDTGTRLSAELRMTVELEVANIEQLTWTTAISELPPGSLFGVVGTAPIGTLFVLSAETGAVLWMVERLLGGGVAGESAQPPQRDLTEIELALARRLFGTIISQLSLVWEELLGLGLSLVQLETVATSLQVAPPSEPTLALAIETKTDSMTSTLSLLVPWRAIEAVVPKLAVSGYGNLAGDEEVDAATAAAVTFRVGEAEVDLRAEVGGVDLSMEDVLAIREGDVLPLGSRASSGVVLCVEGVPVHRAQPGRSGSRRAVAILERLDEPSR